MAATEKDPLVLLRKSIAAGSPIVPTTTPAGAEANADADADADADTNDEKAAAAEEVPLAQATHLRFSDPVRTSVAIDTATRFESNGKPVGLRSIYFAWLNREVAIPEYNASATRLNEELAGRATVHKFAFVERLDLITWLEGASEESEYIRPLAGDGGAGAGGVAGATTAATAAAKAAAASSAARAGRGTLDPRLAQIYSGERRMGDRNTALRGVKPTDFSHVRKLAQPFMAKKPATESSANSLANNPSLAINRKPQRRPDPIILLSPSASSLLRMSNAKTFLEGGRYELPDNAASASMLHVSRLLRDIDPQRPMRFILVEGPEQFKPEYWNRVVAVFTTGQLWQFKNYRWSNPADLFKHVLGVYLGWRGDQLPDAVRAYGHRVFAASVEKLRDPGAPGAESSRWRDREVVENVWKAIEANMLAKGWRKDTAPTSI